MSDIAKVMSKLSRFFRKISDWFAKQSLKFTSSPDGVALFGARRSPQWPRVRREHLEEFPACAACGGTDYVEVHHIKSFSEHPELELEKSNLITLCECGPAGMNCHLYWGHGGNWKYINPFVRSDAVRAIRMLETARCRFLPSPPSD